MARMWVVVGDATTGGGSVVTGSPFTDIDGKAVARLGDKVVCGQHGPTTIVTGDPTTIIDGQPVACHGDSCACGCKLLAVQQPRAYNEAGGGPAAGGRNKSASNAGAATLQSGERKEIARVFWSYGDAESPLVDKSRFYVDLNLHVQTVGYAPGDTVEISVMGADGEGVSSETEAMTVKATVQTGGAAVVRNVFNGQRVELYARD